MPTLGIAVVVVFAAVLAWTGARLLIGASRQRREALDDTCGGLRKVHVTPTPRIGGVAVALGVLGGMVIDWAVSGRFAPWLLLLVCVAPAFIWGLIEDLSKRGAVLPRLVLPAVAGAIGFVLLDARISELDVPGLDNLLVIHAFAFLFTVFAVTGVTHAINVIDGLNGLACVNALLASIGLAVVAAIVGDPFVLSAACVLAASVAGFLLVNYPSGRIFLGDGGAYLVGIVLAELSVLLVQRNSEVSPWFPLVLLAYPIWETLFSMYRRRSRGHSTARADALHLHSLVYRRVVRWRGFAAKPADQAMRNSMASLCLWIMPAWGLAVGLLFWDNSLLLQLAAAAFVTFYTFIYRKLVHFEVPVWLVVRIGAMRTMAELDVDDVPGVSSKTGR